MSEQTAVQESSTTPVMEVERGALVNLTPEQRSEYKLTGELPTPKKEEAATSSESETAKPAGEAEALKNQQEKPVKAKQTAEERIAQLESTIEKIRKGSGSVKPKAEAAPAPEQNTVNRTKPKPDAKNTDGTPKYDTYEEYTLDLTDWRWEQREAEKAAKEQQSAQAKSLNEKIDNARTRYDNVDAVLQPAANEIYQDSTISPVIKQMIGDSDVIVDLLFTLGSDQAEFAKFLKMAKEEPGKAIRYIALTESLIAQELAVKAEHAVVVVEPAKPRTQAPKPPVEVGGRATTPPDSLQAALEGSAGKLGPNLKAEFLRRDLAKLKG
jgi:hypothetical protein